MCMVGVCPVCGVFTFYGARTLYRPHALFMHICLHSFVNFTCSEAQTRVSCA